MIVARLRVAGEHGDRMLGVDHGGSEHGDRMLGVDHGGSEYGDRMLGVDHGGQGSREEGPRG